MENINNNKNSKEENLPKQSKPKKQGNIINQLFLFSLSLMFSGLGEWLGNQKIRSAVFFLLPVVFLVASEITNSPVYLYLSFLTGAFTGPLLITLPLSFTSILPQFNSPIFLFGIPIKFIVVLHSWFLGKKNAKKPFSIKSFLLFFGLSTLNLMLFLIIFSFFTVKYPSYSPFAKTGDFIVISNKITLFPKKLQRGQIVLAKYNGEKHLVRIFALPKDGVYIKQGNFLDITIKTKKDRFHSRIARYNEPCVIMESDSQFSYCNYYYELLVPNKTYLVEYEPSTQNLTLTNQKFNTKFNQRSFSVPKNELLVLPDNRKFFTGQLLIKETDIIGFPNTILWSSNPIEGIIWNRIGKNFNFFIN